MIVTAVSHKAEYNDMIFEDQAVCEVKIILTQRHEDGVIEMEVSWSDLKDIVDQEEWKVKTGNYIADSLKVFTGHTRKDILHDSNSEEII